ncbi:MAG: glycosyltransferase family 39 protein, partial [Bacteroidetes bacterium]|nr:glycosyltransferase family 39 protein [Bacteroidota bacterium]
SLLGALAILFAALLAYRFSGWQAALLVIIFMFFSPRFMGHAMNNTKDMPFAAFYMMAIYFILRTAENIKEGGWRLPVFTALSIGAAINIRAAGIVLIAYAVLFIAIEFWVAQRKNKVGMQYKKLVLVLLLISVLGYFSGLIFWPHGLTSPIANVGATLAKLQKYAAGFSILFEGEHMAPSNVPWYYVLKWMIITIPEVVMLTFLFCISWVIRGGKQSRMAVYLLFVIFFPIVYASIKGSTLYDGWRHFQFVYPP